MKGIREQFNLNSVLMLLLTSAITVGTIVIRFVGGEIYTEMRATHDLVLHISDRVDQQEKRLSDQAQDIVSIKNRIGWGSNKAPMAP